MPVCEHSWIPYPELIGDDTFEKCTVCHAIRTTKKHPINQALASDYGRGYFENRQLCTLINGIPMNRLTTEQHMPHLLRVGLPQVYGSGRVLYVGPGIGQLVPSLLGWGWRVTCVEFGAWAAEYLRHAYPPIEVHAMDFMDFAGHSDGYDCVLAHHVLEHFRAADRALEAMVAQLAPGGRLYIEVPTAKDLYIQDHWWHFAEDTLPLWFTRMGLTEIAEVVQPGMAYHVFGSKPSHE